MRHGLQVAVFSTLVALTFVVVPAAGQPAVGTASVTFTPAGGCNVTVTYTWSGFKGRGLTAAYGAVRSLGGGAEWWLFVTVPATTSGTSSHTFDLAGKGSYTYYGGGRLYDARGRTLSGSDVRSPNSAALDCPPPP